MKVVQCNDFMRGQGYVMGVPMVMQDNTSTISLVTKGGGQYRTKYMRVRQSFVKERVDCGDVAVTHCATLKMLADVLTKPLQGQLYRIMTCGITGVPLHVTGVR